MTSDPRSSQSRHLRRGHLLRFYDTDWQRALDRARTEGHRGLRDVVAGWLVAYGCGRLDAMPDEAETPDWATTPTPPVVTESDGQPLP